MVSLTQRLLGEDHINEGGSENITAPEKTTTEAGALGHRLNALRAGVLGANDGIVSVAALLLGVIGSGMSPGAVFAAGVASTIAGATSMAVGEYVSVSSQRDTEKELLKQERREHAEDPEAEAEELAGILSTYGMSVDTAREAAKEIGEKPDDSTIMAHLHLEYGVDGLEMANPWVAAFASGTTFILGALLPLLSVFFAGPGYGAIVVTAVTLIALAITGYISGVLSKTAPWRVMLRLVIGGALGLAITYGAGALFGIAA